MTTVKIFNQSIGLDTNDFRLKENVIKFLAKYYTQAPAAFNKSPYATPSIDKVFANVVTGESSYIFHRNQFLHLLSFLEQAGYDLKNSEKIDLRDYEVATIDVPIREGWVPYPKQELAIDFLVDNPRYSKLLPTQTGSGKAASLTAKIKVPGGWSTMGEMHVGKVITGKNGEPTTVIGVHPQGVKQLFKVTFEDGRSTRCTSDHLWKGTTPVMNNNEQTVLPTYVVKKIIDENYEYYIDLVDSEGSLENSKLGGHADRLNLALEFIKKHLLYGHDENADFFRLDFSSSLGAAPAVDVFRSLGAVVDLLPNEENDGVIFNGVILLICIKDQYRFVPTSKISNEDLRLRVTSIEADGFEEVQCISVDAPDHLYVTDDYIVTHNSLMSMVTLSRKGLRTGICILPTYIEKTIIDMAKILEMDPKEIMVVQGSKSLGGLIEMAKEGEFNSPFTIFSSTTMSNFNKGYEEEKEFTLAKYGIAPIELFPLLKIGVLLIDETHQHFHIMFKQILNSNVKQLIGMSATFISDDPFVKRMHALIYPQEGIYKNFGHVRYIDVYSISYSVNPDFQKFIRTTEFGSTFYSHTAYEQSIHKNPYLRKRYYNLIRTTLDDYFLSDYKQGDRFAVFVSTVVMATEVTEYLKEAYPLLDIRRYCESDPYTNLTDPDGRVTTVVSAGTNKDIKKLRVVVNTISISSSASNLQLIGRLRELENLDVKFCQLYSEGLRKHHEYKRKREEIFQGKVKAIYERRSRVNV